MGESKVTQLELCETMVEVQPKRVRNSKSRSALKPAPMLTHYLELKRRYPEYILFYQVGDFYEVFYEDAKIASGVLGIRLTARHKEQPSPVPMCGVPVHALENYLPKLIKEGYRCVIMSQVEGESSRKGMVRREINRIITPGIRYDGDGLDEKLHNYLAAACMGSGNSGAVCYVDVSTGLIRLQEVNAESELTEVIERISPSELLVPSSLFTVRVERSERWLRDIKHSGREFGSQVVTRPFDRPQREELFARLISLLPVDPENKGVNAEAFELLSIESLTVLDAVLNYVDEVSFGRGPQLSRFSIDVRESSVFIDPATRRNLELVTTGVDGGRKNSLLFHLDCAKTPMGSRLLRDWILSPSSKREEIEARLASVKELIEHSDQLQTFRELLVSVGDVDRQLSRISSGRLIPRDLGALRDSIACLPEVYRTLTGLSSPYLSSVFERFDTLDDIRTRLEETLCDDLPIRPSEGDIIREGVSAELDKLRSIRQDGKAWLARLEEKEKQRTGIPALKIRFNNVFGYFIEVTKTHLSKIPSDYERKQTLVNAERYITPGLKEFESSILSAKSKQFDIEKQLFLEIREWVVGRLGRIQAVSQLLAVLDVLNSFAHISRERNYCCPQFGKDGFGKDGQMCIDDGRHPVVEQVLGSHNFVPNDTGMNRQSRRFAVLTGPNMGGKSTYLRQIGLIQVMAQSGCFVPARRAALSLVDRVFTRIGSADDITRGESTFMVEMREASIIVRKATERSLVLIDEIGRGTATADGLAIATAVAEWLHDRVGCLTVFATHFHELTSLPELKEAAYCLSVGIIEKGTELVFTHRIEERPGDRSYGIEVARLAGLPESLLARASQVLEVNGSNGLHVQPGSDKNVSESHSNILAEAIESNPIIERLKLLSPNRMTPIEALSELAHLKDLAE